MTTATERKPVTSGLRGIRCLNCGAAKPKSRGTKPLVNGKSQRRRECLRCGAVMLCEERTIGLLIRPKRS